MKTLSFLITAADKINQNKYLEVLERMNLSFKNLKKILILSLTFKVNCLDLRNSSAINLIEILNEKS